MGNEKKEKSGFFANILAALFGGKDSEAEKKRQLRAIAKKLSKSRFNKFYKYNGNEILPAMGKLFFEIYKSVAPLQNLFNSIQNQNTLKHLVINFAMPEEIRALEDNLNEQVIVGMSKKIPLNHLKTQVEEKLSKLNDFFTVEKISAIDGLYRQILVFKAISTFDYYFFLKKFDKQIRENSFSTMPHFEHVNAEYVVDDLKDYIESIRDIPFDSDWTNAIKLLKAFKGGQEPISIGVWKKIIARLLALKNAQTFEMIIKLSSSDPNYVPNIQSLKANIVEPYLDKLKNDVENTVDSLIEKERSATENNFASQLFGETEIMPLNNYVYSKNTIFEQKKLNLFDNCQALSYLKTFLIEVVKKDLREFYDVVVVRGTWDSTTLTTQISDCYNNLLSVSDKLIEFDNGLADDAMIGIKIKTLLPKTECDSSSKNIVNRLISEANESAYEFVMESSRDLITIGKIVKSLVEDLQKPKPTLISNCKELEHYIDIPLKEFCIAIYKKIYLFASLIKSCIVHND